VVWWARNGEGFGAGVAPCVEVGVARKGADLAGVVGRWREGEGVEYEARSCWSGRRAADERLELSVCATRRWPAGERAGVVGRLGEGESRARRLDWGRLASDCRLRFRTLWEAFSVRR